MNTPHNSITTRQGDTLSSIAYRYYGHSSSAVEAILQANPKLSRQSVQLEAGHTIIMPAHQKNTTRRTQQLWD